MKIVIITDLKKRNEKRFSLILTETNAAENVPPFFTIRQCFSFLSLIYSTFTQKVTGHFLPKERENQSDYDAADFI